MTKLLSLSFLLISLISCEQDPQLIEDAISESLLKDCTYRANVLKETYSQCGFYLNETPEDLCMNEEMLLNDYALMLKDELVCRTK